MQSKERLRDRVSVAARQVSESARSLTRFQITAISILLVLLLAGGWVSYARSRPEAVAVFETGAPKSEKGSALLTVHVAGAVVSPGLYKLPEGSRVADAVDKAGGPATGASLDNLNLAARLKDGEKVMVSPGSPSPETGPSIVPPSAAGSQVNINTAGTEELESLPGVGPSLAAGIIRYREENGQFSSLDELDNVDGIGAKRLESLRDLVTI